MTTGNVKAEVEVEADCEEAFCRLIAQRTGIVLQDHQLSNLRDTLRRGCERFAYANAAQYLEALRRSHVLTEQLEYLIAGVTVGESYFFRDSEQFSLLRVKLLPEMIAAKRASGNLSLRIWSAGCSNGQELYTIAMLLQDMIPDIVNWRIHLLGTDINSEAVGKAMRGRYSEWSFRATPQAFRERWFTQVGQEYEIIPQIRRMARFSYLNLSEDVYPSILSETNALDLILCRNVFIYLGTQAVQRSMKQFALCLLDNGVLMLGASDPIIHKHTELELVQLETVGYFRKGGASDTGFDSYLQAVEAMPGEQRTASIKQQPVPLISEMAALPLATAAQPLASGDRKRPADDTDEIISMLKASDWDAALVLMEETCRRCKESSDIWQMKARALANLGRTELALQACVRSLQLDHANKHAYLIQGLILAELDREKEAEDSLRRALYLDHSFLEAHYELGMLKVRAGNLSAAIKSLEIALKLAQTGDPDRELHDAEGMTCRRFAQILYNEIEMLRSVRGK